MATRTISNAGGSWNTVGAWVEGAVPLASDDVVATATSGALTVTASSVCRSMDLTGYTSTISGSGDLSIGDASGGACKLAGTISGTWTTTFKSTSNNGGTGWGITSNGKSFPGSVTFNDGATTGKWTLQDAFVCVGTITSARGTFAGNGQSITCQVFSSSGAGFVHVVDITNCSVTCTTQTGWSFGGLTGLTLTATGSTITLTSSSPAPNFGTSLTYGSVVLSGAGSGSSITATTCTFVNLTITGSASKTATVTFNAGNTVTGTLTLGGNTVQGVNRLLVTSNATGTQRTITTTGAAIVINGDVDFMDIEISSVASWTNSGSAYIGDALGNGANVVSKRTAPATQTHTASAGGNYSDPTKWTSRVPLPQDNVIVDGNTTGTLAVDMPQAGADHTFTGFAGALSLQIAANYFGSVTLASGMSLSGNFTFNLAGRGTHTITSNGKTFPGFIRVGQSNQGTGAGTFTFADAVVTAASIVVSSATATFNGSVSCSTFTSDQATSSVNLNGQTVSLTSSASGTIWSFTGTLSGAAGSTIAFTSASTNSRTFAGGAKTYGTLTYTVAASPGDLRFTSSNTFATVNIGSGRSLSLTSGQTTTITSAFNVNGVANGYWRSAGVAAHYVSSSASAAILITGDLDVRVKVACDDWTPSVGHYLTSVWNATTSNRAWAFLVDPTGKLHFLWSTSGNYEPTHDILSTVAAVIADGSVAWVRVTLDVNNGAAGWTVKFWTSNDGSSWSQLGANVTGAGVTSILHSAATHEISTIDAGATVGQVANYYRVQVRNNILDDGTGIVFDADLTRSLASTGWLDAAKTQFSESSTNAATVTINGTLAQAGDGRVILNSSSAGSAATLSSTVSQTVTGVSIKDSTATGGGTWTDLAAFANVSGNTGWLFVQPLTAAGSLTTAGTAAPKTLMVPTASGTMSTAGGAAVATLIPALASGSMVTDGSGSIATILSSSADGTLSTAGIAAPTVEFAPTAHATMVTGGSGSISTSLAATAAGIVTMNGSGTATAILAAYAAGLLTTAGTASTVMTMRASAGGSLTTAGSGQIALTWRPTASGTLTTAGTARMAVVGTASFRVDVGADSTFHADVGADVSFGVEVDRRA